MYRGLLFAFVLICLFGQSASALTYEPGSDAPTRTIEDYIKKYVDVPKGATDWKVFGKTKEIAAKSKTLEGYDNEYYKPEFPAEIKALEGKQVTVKGYMFPLNSTDKQSLFLIGPFPVNCPYQYHVGSALVIEVHADNHPTEFSYDPITVTGKLELVTKDPEFSVFYRLADAKKVN